MMLIKNEVLQILSGPATLIPLVHVPLLKSAPRSDGDYKVVPDGLGEGDLCHLYGDFSGYHLYMIASAYRTRIVEDSIDYFDKVRGLFSISISFLTDSGRLETVRLDRCSAPLQQLVGAKPMYPEHISVEQLSPGTPDALKFHFPGMNAKFRFSSNLVPHIPESSRFCEDGFFDLRIEYIGKAVGKNGTREIADRLGAGHSKESKILNAFNFKHTNRDAYAVLYKPGRLLSKDGKEQMPYADVIDIAEKSMIGYFKPKENEQSLNFPYDGSDQVANMHLRGISRLQVEVTSPLDYGLLHSQTIEREKNHRFEFTIA